MSESATESITAVEIAPGSYRYTITLTDTGTTPIGTFWFSWVPGAGFLPDPPTFSSPSGWTASQTDGVPPLNGYSIQWVASVGAALQPGQASSGFSFVTSTPPSVLFGLSAIHALTPIVTSVVYSGAPFSDLGYTLGASSMSELVEEGGVTIGVDRFFLAAPGQAYSLYERDFSAGNDFIGSKFYFTGVLGKTYTGEELDKDGSGRITRADFTGVVGKPYSSYEGDYVGGVRAGAKFMYTTVPVGAPYSSYERDFGHSGQYLGEKLFYANVVGRFYTAEELDLDAKGKVARQVFSGISSRPYSSQERDYVGGVYAGQKLFYTGIVGQPYTGREVDYSASGQIEAIITIGMSATPYSSAERDYSGGVLTDVIANYTKIVGLDYYAKHLTDNAHGVLQTEVFDLNSGGHRTVGHANGLVLHSRGDDVFTGGGSGETFVLDAIYGAARITDFAAHASGAGHDVISLSSSEFANFAAVLAAATNVGSDVVIKAADGDSLTLNGLTETTLAGLGADFAFHS